MPKKTDRPEPPATTDGAAQADGAPSGSAPFPIVGIGASAGGLEAFTQLLGHLPLDTGMAFVLVQHLDPEHESALAQLLSRATSLPVREATDNQEVRPDCVYVIPPNTSLGIVRGVLTLQKRPPARTPHHPIDSFFEALAEDRRERAIGVVLSGTATDGTLGLEAIKAEGGITLAQDASARYDSMPRSAVAAGCVDLVLSPADIAKQLARIAKHPHVASSWLEPLASESADPLTATTQEGSESSRKGRPTARPKDAVEKILLMLRNHSGVDFSLYKPSTIRRRISRRILLNRQDDSEQYAQLLRGNLKELDDLYSDALISVTSFFRNPEAFAVLQHKILPQLLQSPGDEPIRVWVLGCSSGQEAYSIAMAFVEVAERAPRLRKLQVFATDLNETVLNVARHGLYAKSIARDLTPERLRRFFVEEDGGYRIAKPLREMVVFARQNVISDPPFSRIDLISCRNLLIYLEPSLQRKLFPVFHYALKPGGVLYLGASETIGGFTELFEPADKKHKIYRKKVAPTWALPLPVGRERAAQNAAPGTRTPLRVETGREAAEGNRSELNAEREADRVAVKQFAPPAVLVNADLQILQFRGPTSAYLEPASGKASFDVLKMARGGLMLPLRAAIQKARKDNRPARKENVRIEQAGATRTVNVEVIPLKNLRERCFLIVFEDVEPGGRTAPGLRLRPSARAARPPRRSESRRIAELETELGETRDYLQTIREQHEAANEELHASNEEVQSANEELQSVNEELETSKEELESANEELTTVNEEMASRNAELVRLNSDLVNVQTSARLAIVLVARDLTIRRFSTAAERQLGLLAGDVGGPIHGIRQHLDLPDLEPFVREVIDTGRENEREVQDREGRWYSLRVRPYLTFDDKVDGAVLVLFDIDALKRSEQAIAAARDYAENTIETVREPLLVLDDQLRVERANRSFYHAFRVAPAETVGRSVFELGDGQWDVPRLRTLLEEILPQSAALEDFEVEHDFDGVGRRTMLLNARRIHDPAHRGERILLAFEDVTERRFAETTMRDTDRRKDEFLATLAHELRNPLAPMRSALEIIRQATGTESPIASRAVRSSHEPGARRLDPSHPIQSAVEMLERQVGQMVRLVDDLLDADRIGRGRIELRQERVDLSSIVDQAVEANRPHFESRGNDLAVVLPPEPLYVEADPARLAQIVGNLLSNACKYTRDGSVSLTVERGNANVVIRVRDTGIGIGADQLPHVFEMFMQVDSSLEGSAGGLGIGLTLVKQLVDLHGGTVEAHSAGLGTGSEFVVHLPIPPETQGPSRRARAGHDPSAFKARRILVVDDNRDAAESVAMLLERGGHETHIAYDGLEAVEAAARLRPDVILMDIGLPNLNGYEAARRIRAQREGRGLVLVALTGWGQEQDRRRSEEAGIDAHLVKPVEHDVLMKLLAGLGGTSRH